MLDSAEGEVFFGLVVVDFLLEKFNLFKVGLSLVPVEVHLPLDLEQPLLDMFFHLFEVLDFQVILMMQVHVLIFILLFLSKP